MKKKKLNGEGTIYKTRYGYRGQVVVGFGTDGKPIRHSVSAPTKAEVKEKVTAIKHSIQTGTYIPPNKLTVCDLAKVVLDEDRMMNHVKEATYARSLETLKKLETSPYLRMRPLQELTEPSLKNYLLSQCHLSQSYVDKIYALLQRTMRGAVKRKIITENPIQYLKRPKSTQKREKVRALTPEEEVKLYKVLTTEDVLYSHQMLLSMLTGMRMGEINALTREDIDLYGKTITVNKTVSRGLSGKAFVSEGAKTANGNRTILISDTVMPLIKEILQCAGETYLFECKGNPVDTPFVNRSFQEVVKKYGIVNKKVRGHVSLHSLRHTFATRCIEAGMQPKVLQHILGHSDIRITLNTYCDAFEQYQRESIAKTDDYFAHLGIRFTSPTPPTPPAPPAPPTPPTPTQLPTPLIRIVS